MEEVDVMDKIQAIIDAIKIEEREFTKQGWNPILRAHKDSQILIIGQAPGIKTQLRNDVFRDQSGDRLRDWMGIDETVFYNTHLISVLPMDFYFPGKAKTGDNPPRKEFADKWHPMLIKEMPNIELIILIGAYAINHYLKEVKKKNLTDTVKHFDEYLPLYFPLVHPSPLNRRWEAKNPWFETEVLPVLKTKIKKLLEKYELANGDIIE